MNLPNWSRSSNAASSFSLAPVSSWLRLGFDGRKPGKGPSTAPMTNQIGVEGREPLSS